MASVRDRSVPRPGHGQFQTIVPECPVCMEALSAPIIQCDGGHSFCKSCTINFNSTCPICRDMISNKRNYALEDMISKTSIPCPNKSKGCILVLPSSTMENHLPECIFREMNCPLHVFGKCSWKGLLKNMQNHFKESHPANCSFKPNAEQEIDNVNLKEDDHFFYYFKEEKNNYVVNFKIDTIRKMAYWSFQIIGQKKTAQQNTYTISIMSKKDNRRSISFTDHCFNDDIKSDEIFRIGKCAMIPLDLLAHFVVGRKMNVRVTLQKTSFVPKPKTSANKSVAAAGKKKNLPKK